MFQNLIRGLTVLGNGPAIAYLVAGSLMGMFIGVIPGLGGVVILTIILAFIYHINLDGTLCLFLASQAGSYFSASITSILLNTPAHPEAFAVTFDGFPMAQRGEAGRALGISATSTCIGGFIGCAVLVGFIQIINPLQTVFHPPEYVALIVIALLLVATLGTDAVSKALISTGIALMISSIGSDPVTGVYRYTFGSVGLLGGVSLVALFLGLFAIPQMVLVFGTATTIAKQDMMGNDIEGSTPVTLERGFMPQVFRGVLETLHHWVALVGAALVGVVTGVIPGIGGFAANFMSYGLAQQFSRNRANFGTGIAEGIIAPEGSSLAKEAGGMVPLLGLGIPGGVGGALFLAALSIKGIKVGYGLTTNYPTLAYETVWIIALGGLVGTVAGILAAPLLARVTRVPGPLLVPFIMSITIVGTFASDVSFFSVMEVLLFAVVGLVLRRLRYSLAAFGIGLVLGPTLESNIYLTNNVFPHFSFLSRRPLADVLFCLAIALVVTKAIQLRKPAASLGSLVAEGGDQPARQEGVRAPDRERRPYPLLSLVATLSLAAICIPFAIYGGTHYSFTNALMPVLGAAVAGSVALWRLPFDVGGYVHYRHEVAATAVPRLASSGPALETGGPASISRRVADEETAESGKGVPSLPDGGPMVPVRDKAWGMNGQYSRELLAFGWLLFLVAGCYAFGFEVGVDAFCLLYGLAATRRIFRSVKNRAAFGVFAALVMGLATHEIQSVLHLTFAPLVRL